MGDIVIRRFDELAWTEDGPADADAAQRMAAAKAAGYKHKRLLAGEGDTYMNYVEMGPGFEVAAHSHDVREVIHVLGGSLTPEGTDRELGVGDSLVVPAGATYGFRCGSQGVRFIVMRPGDAAISYQS